MQKIALFAFTGELTCFAHALLNAIDMQERGMEVRLILEGASTGLLKDFDQPETPFRHLFFRCVEEGLLDCVCKACSAKMGTLKIAQRMELPLNEEMSGHPSMGRYIEAGYKVITI
ncbi:hypothetical protein DC28_09435 [Spirochaeta lutea]|uniref:Cytoplasmic protein n=1 Tax=Spirochaeta lutea TaxID=1480694 RepID=A0A098QWP5_9SPIO|nr:hypothetical protein DC28_09435 [Spirochaeta lutea]